MEDLSGTEQLSTEEAVKTSPSIPSGLLYPHPTHVNSDSNYSHDVELTRTKSIAEQMPPLYEFLFVGLLCATQLTTRMTLCDTLTIVRVIGKSLGISDPVVLSWLIAGYSLTIGSLILISGRFGDIFGYKKMLIIGYLWFSTWNLVAGWLSTRMKCYSFSRGCSAESARRSTFLMRLGC